MDDTQNQNKTEEELKNNDLSEETQPDSDQIGADSGSTEAEEDQEPETPSEQEDPESEESSEEKAEEVTEETPEPVETASAEVATEESETPEEESEEKPQETEGVEVEDTDSPARWYVVHTYSGHENKVATALKQRVESEHLEDKIIDVLVPTQEKIEIKGGKKETIKEKIFPGYILVKMVLDDEAWLAVRTTQGVTAFIGMGGKPTPISEKEVRSIVSYMSQGGQPTYKQVFSEGDTVKITDGPFTEFIGKVDSVDKERGKVRVLVSIFGRETPVELDFLQVAKL